MQSSNKAVNKLNNTIVQLGRELFDGRMVARSRVSIQIIRIIKIYRLIVACKIL